jgi:Asp/Glu/hydantoin racemase
MARLGLIHTVAPLIAVFKKLCADILPSVEPVHILDEPLLKIIQEGSVSGKQAVLDRLVGHVAMEESAGAGAVLVTCSSVSPLVDDIRDRCSIPVFKIDDAMLAEAVERGPVIGVVATASTTLGPTRQALERRAERTGKKIDVKTLFVEGALNSLLSGEGSAHDARVKDAIAALSAEVDVVVLAQASMARVLEVLPEGERRVPVLSSPHLALGQVKNHLDGIKPQHTE